MKGVDLWHIGRAQADVHPATVGDPPHSLAFVDPKFRILLAEADGGVGQIPNLEKPSGASTAV